MLVNSWTRTTLPLAAPTSTYSLHTHTNTPLFRFVPHICIHLYLHTAITQFYLFHCDRLPTLYHTQHAHCGLVIARLFTAVTCRFALPALRRAYPAGSFMPATCLVAGAWLPPPHAPFSPRHRTAVTVRTACLLRAHVALPTVAPALRPTPQRTHTVRCLGGTLYVVCDRAYPVSLRTKFVPLVAAVSSADADSPTR